MFSFVSEIWRLDFMGKIICLYNLFVTVKSVQSMRYLASALAMALQATQSRDGSQAGHSGYRLKKLSRIAPTSRPISGWNCDTNFFPSLLINLHRIQCG